MKKISIVILTIFNVTFYYSQSLYEKGFKEYNNDHFENAIRFFTSSIEQNEQVVDSYMYRGMSYLFLEKAVEAQNDLNKAFEIDPNNSSINGFLAKFYNATDQYGKALENYNIALKKKPENYSLYSERAAAKVMLGMYDEALVDADIAIINLPLSYNVYLNRGYVKLRSDKYAEAVEDFNHSLKLKESHKGYGNRGTAYALMKKYDLALNDFDKALKYNPDDLLILYYQGEVLLSKGEKVKACESFIKSRNLGNNQIKTVAKSSY